jgi:putative flippase GtrA
MEQLSPSPIMPQRKKVDDLFRNKTDSTLVQLFRYAFVGGVAFLADISALLLLTELARFHYLASAALAFWLGLATNYALSVLWVFDTRRLVSPWVEFLVFVSIGVIGLGMNEVIIWFFTERIRIHYLGSKVVSTVFVFLWNFIARKITLFS